MTSSPFRRIARIALRVAIVLLAVGALAGAALFALVRKFYPSPRGTSFPAARTASEAQLQDLHALREYLTLDRSYAAAARAQAEVLVTESEDRVRRDGALAPAAFDLVVARVVAAADNGHSRLKPLSVADRHPRLPCRLYRFSDGLYVVRARGSCSEILGARIVAIDGRSVADVVDGMYPFVGGPRNHYDQFSAPFFLESPEILHAAGFARADDHLSLTVADGDRAREVTMQADPPDPEAPRSYSDEYLSPRRIRGEGPEWRPVLPPESVLPAFLQDYDDPFQARYLAADGAYYLLLRSNEDEPGHPIGPFLKRAAREIADTCPRAIVLDVRLNQGGNLLTTASLMEDLATLCSSTMHVFALTGAWTFSAGIFDVALLKEHGKGKVVVVGEPVGDRIRFWAEGGGLTLPNSKLRLTFATGLHDYSSPCNGQEGCFWPLRLYPMHNRTLEPDVVVTYPFADYRALRDPLLEAALSRIKG